MSNGEAALYALGIIVAYAFSLWAGYYLFKRNQLVGKAKNDTDTNIDASDAVISEIMLGSREPDFKDEFIKRGYMIFYNIVIDSPEGNTAHSEIDIVIVTQYHVTSIECKGHYGNIYGSQKLKNWVRYRRNGERDTIYNPIWQNFGHVRALEDRLKGKLKAPINNYVILGNAGVVGVDASNVFRSTEDAERALLASNGRKIYTLDEVNEIAKNLTIAKIVTPHLLPLHIAEVEVYKAHLGASA